MAVRFIDPQNSLAASTLAELQSHSAGTEAEPVVSQLWGSTGEASLYLNRTGALGAGVEETVIDTTEPVVIDLLTWASNDASNAQVRLQPYVSGVETSVGEAQQDGSAVHGFTPSDINTHASTYWETLIYDATGANFKFALRIPLSFPEGVKITVRNTSGVSINNALVGLARQLR